MAPELAPIDLCPWMDAPGRVTIDRQIIFGHWATLNGRRNESDLIALDTGCVWGGNLTAIRLDDRQLVQVASVFDLNAFFAPLTGVDLDHLEIYVVGGVVRDSLLGLTPKRR